MVEEAEERGEMEGINKEKRRKYELKREEGATINT